MKMKSVRQFASHILDLIDTELGDGHYWANDDLIIDFPLRFVGDENNAGNVVVEMGSTLMWRARGGYIEGITLRRPKLSSSVPMMIPLVTVEDVGKIDLLECCFDNAGSRGPVVSITGQGTKGRWERILFKGGSGGILLDDGASLELTSVRFRFRASFSQLVLSLTTCFCLSVQA